MKIVVVILIGIIIMLLTYIFMVKKEILRVSKKLKEHDNLNKDKKIDINLINKEIEELGKSINNHIEISNNMKLKEKKSKEELKEVISNIAHDLRTPLTTILGYIQVIKRGNISEEKKIEYIDKIECRSRDLNNLINEFFVLSISEREDFKLNLEEIYLKEILTEKVIEFYEMFEEKSIEPSIEIKSEGHIVADGRYVIRIIENLLYNCIKYSDGEVVIKLFESDEKVLLEFKNGINKEVDIDKIFDKFYKGNDKSRRGVNTGIGLAIVKNLVEKMDGEVGAEIKDNKLGIKVSWKKN